jgi:hypothetical protein
MLTNLVKISGYLSPVLLQSTQYLNISFYTSLLSLYVTKDWHQSVLNEVIVTFSSRMGGGGEMFDSSSRMDRNEEISAFIKSSHIFIGSRYNSAEKMENSGTHDAMQLCPQQNVTRNDRISNPEPLKCVCLMLFNDVAPS